MTGASDRHGSQNAKVKIMVSCLFITKRFGCPAKLMFFSRIISNLATTKDDFEYAA